MPDDWGYFPERHPIHLWEGDAPGWNADYHQNPPTITPYLAEGSRPRGAVIVCAGGGYGGKAYYEAHDPAVWLNSLGIHAFVLDYRVAPYRHPWPLRDAQRAIRLIRYRAKELGVLPDCIGILGFSAGGHLSAAAATLFDDGNRYADDPIERVSSRPDAAVLLYAVVTMEGPFKEVGSINQLLGEKRGDPMLTALLSSERQVSGRTPPMFLFHTGEDTTVPAENSLMMAEALRMAHVPFELHIFPHAPHGVALNREKYPVETQWMQLCGSFLRGLGF